MREIKFRGKRVDNGEWVYGDLVRYIEPLLISEDVKEWVIVDEIAQEYTVDKETVGQFTGLVDKNDKEIYEGDFIKLKYPNDLRQKTTAIIVFDEQTKSLRFKVYESTEYYVLYNHLPKYLNFEVIGNIYDNMELLNDTNR